MYVCMYVCTYVRMYVYRKYYRLQYREIHALGLLTQSESPFISEFLSQFLARFRVGLFFIFCCQQVKVLILNTKISMLIHRAKLKKSPTQSPHLYLLNISQCCHMSTSNVQDKCNAKVTSLDITISSLPTYRQP